MDEIVMTRDHPTHTRNYSLGMLTGIAVAVAIFIVVLGPAEAALSRWMDTALWLAVLVGADVGVVGLWAWWCFGYCRCAECGRSLRRSGVDVAYSYFLCSSCRIQWRTEVMVKVADDLP